LLKTITKELNISRIDASPKYVLSLDKMGMSQNDMVHINIIGFSFPSFKNSSKLCSDYLFDYLTLFPKIEKELKPAV